MKALQGLAFCLISVFSSSGAHAQRITPLFPNLKIGAPLLDWVTDSTNSMIATPSLDNIIPLNRNKLGPGFNTSALIIPLTGIAYGVAAFNDGAIRTLNISTRNEIQQHHASFSSSLDDYLQWSPAVAVIGLNAAGIRGRNSFGNELLIYGVSTTLMAGTVYSLKHCINERRPDGSNAQSFPSGHTATAFAAAEWLRTEYHDRSPWIGVAGYLAATATGVLRMFNNRHWISDVVSGAAVGFLCTRAAYCITPWIKKSVLRKSAKQPIGF